MTLMASNLNFGENNSSRKNAASRRRLDNPESDNIQSRIEEEKSDFDSEMASPFEDPAFLNGEARDKSMTFGP